MAAPKAGATDGKAAGTSSSPPTTAGASAEEKARACAPGRTCVLLYPEKPEKKVRKKAVDALTKKSLEINGQ